ncbi:heme ABC transporter ATP-binding protein [Microbacterium sp. NPDC077184]|uniref:heme ABC transporter ATP-binding protein n=1 Tax=Microbacterium sp. NPDC077184 TaxID=3154764 RepID=UPI0034240BA2
MSGLRDAVLEARDVTVVPDGGRREILSGASLGIRAGEVHALVGPNGAGKSTLFGVIAGDVVPSAGSVHLDGVLLAEFRPRDLARRRAVLLQQNAVSFPFTVAQVVAMGRAPWARTPLADDDEAAIAAALEDTDIVDLADRTVPSLSGGERARAALARVLAQRTDILLLDEPTAALDLRHQEDVLALAVRRAREGAAVAVVLHDLNSAMAHADRVTLLSRGRVVAAGIPAEVLTAERIEEVYGQAVDVFPHPATGVPVVTPRRRASDRPAPW